MRNLVMSNWPKVTSGLQIWPKNMHFSRTFGAKKACISYTAGIQSAIGVVALLSATEEYKSVPQMLPDTEYPGNSRYVAHSVAKS